MKKQPRIMCVNSLSCFGKNALTIGLPMISAAGSEAVPLPTVLLSSQPGGLAGYSYHELTDDMKKAWAQWRELSLEFDCAYTGYLCSDEQVDIACDIFDALGHKNALRFADPAMADNGRMYSVLKPEFAKSMARLCAKADIICPNITEAAFMLGEDFIGGPYEKPYIEGLVRRLAISFPAGVVILTGVHFENENIGAAVFERKTDSLYFVMGERLAGHFHGTGDVFSSSFLGALFRGHTIKRSVEIAVSTVKSAIANTLNAATDPRHGLAFEGVIPEYIRALETV